MNKEPVTLELLGAQITRVFDELREIKNELRDQRSAIDRVVTGLGEINADMASLARVMLRLESRVHALEAARS